MADIDLLFFLRPARRNEIADIVVDATVREQHEFTAQVAEHPIETGAQISDHIHNEPVRLVMEGEVTDTPVQILGGLLSGEGGDRRLEAYDTLRTLYLRRQPIDVVTGLAVYRNMAITSMTFPRDRRTGLRLQFVMEFKQLELVETITRARVRDDIAVDQQDIAQETQNVGRSGTREATGAESSRTGSFLNEWLGELF